MNPIRTALLSFGLSGKAFHAPFLDALPGFELAGVWERSSKKAAQLYPQIQSYDSLESLLSDRSIELVVVNTPNSTHYAYTTAALLAGKHVIVEKPFVPTVAEGEELLALAAEKGLQLSVYQNRRWDSDFLTVKRVLQQASLGTIVEAAFHFDRYNPALSSKEHKETAAPGVGIHYDLGSHIIDSALYLFGMPQSVFADLRKLRAGTAIYDDMELLLFYAGLRVRVHSSYFVREPLPAFQLYGTNGSFAKARADVQEGDLLQGRSLADAGWGTEPAGAEGLLHISEQGSSDRSLVPSERGNYAAYFEGVYQALRYGAPMPVTGEEGLNVIRVLEAAERSAASGMREPV
ncbi:MAG: oxidoreductase [Chitinophagaceae bacterium]|nr:MAG: oxidoreductase [Chitinophagaceae bacterium]